MTCLNLLFKPGGLCNCKEEQEVNCEKRRNLNSIIKVALLFGNNHFCCRFGSILGLDR